MTYPIQRRVILRTLVTATTAVGTQAHAQALVDEKGTQAVALGYVADARRVGREGVIGHAARRVCGRRP